MARTITGNAYESRGKWYARVSLGIEIEWKKGRTDRPHVLLVHFVDRPNADMRAKLIASCARSLVEAGHLEYVANTIGRLAEIDVHDETALAKAVATVRAITAGKVKIEPISIGGMTFGELAADWTSGKLHAKYPEHVKACRDMATNKGRLESYVLPVVRDVPLSAFSVANAKAVMAELPPEWKVNTRRHVAQLIHRVLGLAVWPVEAIKVNPLPKGFLPKKQKGKVGAFLYPDEDAKLVGAPLVPLQARVLLALLNREGMRKEEAASLEWTDLDFAHGRIVLDRNKTDDPRSWPMNRGVKPAMERWRELCPSKQFVFPNREATAPMNVEHLADWLRDWLKTAGVDRPQLSEHNDVRRHIVAHDLRATFVTIHLAEGKPEKWIKRRTGHKSNTMIETYARVAEDLAEGEAVALVPMEQAIPELRPPQLAAEPVSIGGGRPRRAFSRTAARRRFTLKHSHLCDGRESNPQASRRWNLKTLSGQNASGIVEQLAGSIPDADGIPTAAASSPPIEPTLLDRLAALVRDAVAGGDTALARSLLDAYSASSERGQAMSERAVIDLSARRARKA